MIFTLRNMGLRAGTQVGRLHAGRKLRCMLDVRRLRVLCAVADHRTLSAAAEALSYTPSAVSQPIVALERETGVRRAPPRPARRPPDRGGTAARRAGAPDPLRAAGGRGVAGRARRLGRGRLHLASFATAGATILPLAIAEFRTRHPEVGITLAQADPHAAMGRLRAGDVDLIVTADAQPQDDGDASSS